MDTATTIDVLVTGLIKPALLLLIIVMLWLLVRNKSAALQHFVLSLGFLWMLLLPLLANIAPVIPLNFESTPLIIQWISHEYFASVGSLLEQGLTQVQWLILLALYLFPASSLLFYLLLGVIGLWQQKKSAQKIIDPELLAQAAVLCELVDVQRPVKLLTSPDVKSPYTWGLFRPVIVLPRAVLLWDEDKRVSVLMHELGHIARWDWLISLLVKITCAIFWFLLPIWWVAHQLFLQAEIACDDYIYKLRDKHLSYAKNLLAFATLEGNHPVDESAMYMRGHSDIHQRILAVLDKQRPHQPIATESAQYWVLIGGLLLGIFASVQWIPLRAQMNASVNNVLKIHWEGNQDALLHNTEVRSEIFSWALMQSLKPVLSDAPSPLEIMEQVHVEAVKPDKTELTQLSGIELGSPSALPIPRIQVEGFLPVTLVTPVYPARALSKGIEGWVEVEFTIDTTGHIINPRIINRSPSRVFDRSVLTALKKSHYRPQVIDGQPIVVQGVTELFRFTLLHDDSATGARPADVATRRR